MPAISLEMRSASVHLYAEIGRRIREHRIHARRDGKKMTQERLALALGLTRAAVSNIETGKQQIYIHTLFRIADVLRVDISNFLPSTSDLKLNPLEVGLATKAIDPESRKKILELMDINRKLLAAR